MFGETKIPDMQQKYAEVSLCYAIRNNILTFVNHNVSTRRRYYDSVMTKNVSLPTAIRRIILSKCYISFQVFVLKRNILSFARGIHHICIHI